MLPPEIIFFMSHTCSTIIFHCIDFRFGGDIKAFLEERNLLGDIDIVSLAGVCKNIIDPAQPTDREFVLRQLDISKRLHNVCDVILMNHTDCGAYGGRSAFASIEAEEARHVGDMRETRAIIAEKYPDLNVRMVLAHIEDGGKIEFKDIEA